MLEQLHHQVIIDGSQTTDTSPTAKLMQHPYIRCALTMGQVGKATPTPALRQQSHDAIVTVRAGQHRQ
jgi:hypothetical protein